jgi:hypothetical protein
VEADHPINLLEDSLLKDTSILPQMRFLFNDRSMLELSISLVLSAIHLGNQGNSEKDKMRTALRQLLESFLDFPLDIFTQMRKEAAKIGDNYLEEAQVEEYSGRTYSDVRVHEGRELFHLFPMTPVVEEPKAEEKPKEINEEAPNY